MTLNKRDGRAALVRVKGRIERQETAGEEGKEKEGIEKKGKEKKKKKEEILP